MMVTLVRIDVTLDQDLWNRIDDEDLEYILDRIIPNYTENMQTELTNLLEAKAEQVKVTT